MSSDAAYLQSLNQQAPSPEGMLFIADFAARGWNPTQPDEQLLGSAGAPSSGFSVAAAAPWASPDMHDVDFWNGYLNKRNGTIAVGSPLVPGSAVIGLFKYAIAQANGTLTKLLVAVCNGVFFSYAGIPNWTQYALTGWNTAVAATFAVMQNQLCVFSQTPSNVAPLCPRWWDGASQNLGYLGNRLSPFYLAASGQPLIFAAIQSVAAGLGGAGPTLTMAANQAASGLYLGMSIYVDNGNYFETAFVSAFTTTGTAGTANYYVTSITLQTALRYPAQNYTRISWNGITIVGQSTGGTITITGNTTTVLMMAVTNLNSGGSRASVFSVDVPVTTTGLITVENLNFAGGDGNLFGSDLSQGATTWYMTPPFNPQTQPSQAGGGPSQIFYQVPPQSADMVPPANPMANNAATVQFLNTPDIVNYTWTTLEAATAVDSTGYFTGQIDVPLGKFAVNWQGFLCVAGDPWNQSRLWLSGFGSPQVWGTQGGLDGAYIDIPNADDGQVITALYVGKNGLLYVGKTNSLYAVNFNGNTSLSPFQVIQCSGAYGPLSSGSFQESEQYVFFFSNAGLCAVSMYSVSLLQSSKDIRAKFTGPNAWNLALMALSQSVVLPAKNQIHFQAAQANRGDQTLVYDWLRDKFWYQTAGPTAIPARLYASLCEDLTNSPSETYAGDNNGQVWLLDQDGTDETVPVDFHYETPWLHAGDPGMFKMLEYLYIGGTKQAYVQGQAPILNVVIYLDFNPKAQVVRTFDMSQQGFEVGLNMTTPVQLGLRCKYFKIALVNNTSGCPVSIRFMRLKFKLDGEDL